MIDGLFLADIALKGAIVLAATTLLAAVLRGASAAARHVTWALALGSVLTLPAWKAGLPDWSPPGAALLATALARGPSPGAGRLARGVGERPDPAGADAVRGQGDRPGPSPATREDGPARAEPGGRDGPAVDGAVGGRLDGEAAAARGFPDTRRADRGAAASQTTETSSGALLVALWLTGVLAVLARAARGLRARTRLAGGCTEARPGPLRSKVERLAREAGIAPPRLLLGHADLMPMAWGVLRPTIALPATAAEWTPRRVRAVLRHEIAHLRRRDPLSQSVADLVCALHWFDPLAWYAAARLRAERELACDDEALAATRASDYAAELVGVARTMRAPRAVAALPMARASQLGERVRAVLDERRTRSRVCRAWVASGACACALLVAPLAAATTASGSSAGTERDAAGDAAGTRTVSPELRFPLADGAAPTRVADPEEGGPPRLSSSREAGGPPCWEGDWKGSRTHNVNDDVHRVKWESGGCELDLRLEGEVRFNRDFDGIASMGAGSAFRLREDDRNARRELEAVPGRDGTPLYTYRVGGREAEFDADARRWFARILLQLARNAGFGAEQRVAALLESGGPDAVLGEIPLLGGDWVRSVYLGELADQSQLDPAQVERGLRLAARHIESDHYMAEVAGRLAAEGPLRPGSRDALIATLSSMDSDHYKAEVTTRALDGGPLAAGTMEALLDATSRFGSDHYKAGVLTGVAERYPLAGAERDAYLGVARAMESDHYRSLALDALLDAGGSGVAEVVTMATADAMESDHYAAEVISHAAASGLPGRDGQAAFVRAVAGMESDHYRAATLRALLDAGADDPSQVATVLVAARSIESDHYLAETLAAVAGRVRLEGALRDAFEESMRGIESETYYGRVARLLNR